MFDIPNYVTLPLEIGVAVLILMMDRRQRKRDAKSLKRSQLQIKETREAEIRQRERFNNWAKESSKRQIMLLESIMATLDADKLDDFKSEVGSRYAKELNQDMEDLDDLLEKKKLSDESDPVLEADIESKIDEISSAKDFIKNFVPREIITEIEDIASSAKAAYIGLQELPKHLSQRFPEGGRINIEVDHKNFSVNPEDEDEVNELKDEVLKNYKEDRNRLFDTLNATIRETIDEVTSTLNGETRHDKGESNAEKKILDTLKESLLSGDSIGKMLDKAKKFGERLEKTGEKSDQTDKKEKEEEGENSQSDEPSDDEADQE